jgi:uncharacterized protein
MSVATEARVSPGQRRTRGVSAEVIALLLLAAALLRPQIAGLLQSAALRNWSTIFVAITLQALPFLVGGVVVSGAIAAFVPTGLLASILPGRSPFVVPLAATAGMALPGCECGSVPIAGRLIARGAPAPAALAFLLAAPAINPVVLIATAVAFPGQPKVVAARYVASLATATIVGLIWFRVGREKWTDRVRKRLRDEEQSRLATFAETVQHDFLHAGGFLVLGGIAAATLQTVVPRTVLDSVAGSGVAAVAVMALLAVVLAVCSEADAFVAASLAQFSLTSRLVFLVVGPAVDIKLVALQAGVFGRPFAVRFAPLTLVVAIGCALVAGWVLL